MLNFKNSSLLVDKLFINGDWVESDSRFDVINPANEEVLCSVADAQDSHVLNAIDAASEAFNTWRDTTAAYRSELLYRWYELITENTDDLATLMTLEQGKPLAESVGEIRYGASLVKFYAQLSTHVSGDILPSPFDNRRTLVMKQPVGVVAAITPWNFPNSMIVRKLAPALAVGCTAIVKPAPDTPLSALAVAELARQAEIPAGVINVLPTTRAVETGKHFCSSKKISKLTFTGSTAVGKILMQQCASTVKKVSMELGGNAPFIIFDDADIDAAVSGVVASKFRNAGQTCVSANRVLVAKSIADIFKQKLLEKVHALTVGDGMQSDTDIGPLISKQAKQKVDSLVAGALDTGANRIFGDESANGLFYNPTVVDNVTPDMEIFHTEIFGPVVSLIYFSDDEEAIKIANDSEYGLAAYFYTQNLSRMWRVSEKLEYGIVGVNEGVVTSAEVPFGGMKESGIGREGSVYGLDEYVEIKSVSMAI